MKETKKIGRQVMVSRVGFFCPIVWRRSCARARGTLSCQVSSPAPPYSTVVDVRAGARRKRT